MTPEYAESIDPVFMRVLGLLEQIDRDEPVSAENERVAIRSYLAQAEGRVGQRTDWELTKYALVSWIDEVLIQAKWEGRSYWVNNTLEWEEFRSADCAEQFFKKAKEATALPNRDALEVFYICMVLGFRGLYRDRDAAAALAEPLGLPPALETWAKQVSMAIHLGQGRPSIPNESEPIGGVFPLEGQFQLIWAVFVTMIIAAVTGVVLWSVLH